MAGDTNIEWADAVWNPIVGCSVHSAGCTNCYAMKMAGRLEAMAVAEETKTGDPGPMKHYMGTTKATRAGFVWTGKVNLAPEATLLKPLSWKKPRKIFVNSMSDLFHDSVPNEWIDRIFAVMALCPHHQFQVLTKRSARMRDYFADPMIMGRIAAAIGSNLSGGKKITWRWPLPNVWLGVSVEDQRAADERIPDLLETPAAVRWLSCEPLLGAVDLRSIRSRVYTRAGATECLLDALTGYVRTSGPPAGGEPVSGKLDWIVAGGESGPGARPMHPDWARSLRDQCAAAGVPFLFKQWGEFKPYEDERADCFWLDPNGHVYGGPTNWPPLPDEPRAAMCRVGKKAAGRLLDGVEHNEFPA